MDTELLPEANRSNIRIKDYILYIQNEVLEPSIPRYLYEDIRNTLIDDLEEIDEYLESLRQYEDNNSPRDDRLTKESVKADLYTNVEEIRKLLTYMRDSIDDGSLTITEEESGGKRKNKKGRKTKKGKRTNKKSKSRKQKKTLYKK